jgi:hypothetical protein
MPATRPRAAEVVSPDLVTRRLRLLVFAAVAPHLGAIRRPPIRYQRRQRQVRPLQLRAQLSAGERAPVDVARADEPALFERALELYWGVGDLCGQAEAQFWIGAFHQVVRDNDAAAVPALERARALATQADDSLIQSYALRHLGIVEHRAGHLGQARRHLEESTRLRRRLGFGPAIAANLVGLAYIAAADGRDEEVPAMLDDADSIASGVTTSKTARGVRPRWP